MVRTTNIFFQAKEHNMNLPLLLLAAVLSVLAVENRAHIARTKLRIPHRLLESTNNSTIETTVPFIFYARRPVRKRPLLLLLPGALVLSSDYRTLSSALAYRGFIVAVPEYTQRNLTSFFPPFLVSHITRSVETQSCPVNGNFVSAALVSCTFFIFVF